jgi:hypothetical protein
MTDTAHTMDQTGPGKHKSRSEYILQSQNPTFLPLRYEAVCQLYGVYEGQYDWSMILYCFFNG